MIFKTNAVDQLINCFSSRKDQGYALAALLVFNPVPIGAKF